MSGSTSRMPGHQRHAADVLAAVAPPLSDVRVLAVQCANGHHVAGVYETPQGRVVQAASGRHSHGRRDRVDTPHHGGTARLWTDFFDSARFADDTLPAWCECGPWTLSRQQMAQWIDAGQHRVVLESKS